MHRQRLLRAKHKARVQLVDAKPYATCRPPRNTTGLWQKKPMHVVVYDYMLVLDAHALCEQYTCGMMHCEFDCCVTSSTQLLSQCTLHVTTADLFTTYTHTGLPDMQSTHCCHSVLAEIAFELCVQSPMGVAGMAVGCTGLGLGWASMKLPLPVARAALGWPLGRALRVCLGRAGGHMLRLALWRCNACDSALAYSITSKLCFAAHNICGMRQVTMH